MFVVQIIVRNPAIGDVRLIERRLDPTAFARPNWDATFDLVQAVVEELKVAAAVPTPVEDAAPIL